MVRDRGHSPPTNHNQLVVAAIEEWENIPHDADNNNLIMASIPRRMNAGGD